jgi:hypothetical protein
MRRDFDDELIRFEGLMHSSRVGFAAFTATVSLCVFSGGVAGAVDVSGPAGDVGIDRSVRDEAKSLLTRSL